MEVLAAFAAGLATSVGPCVAPRYLLLTALLGNSYGWARIVRIGCFMAGLLACLLCLAFAASWLAKILALSRFIYIVMALAFVACGMNGLVVKRHYGHDLQKVSSGSALLAGASLGLIFSPCCMPSIGVLVTLGASTGSPVKAIAMGAAFLAGHMAPLGLAGIGIGTVRGLMPTASLEGPVATISNGLMIALGGYYGLLA
jgi:cytochrome c biogenesis protein CcdA